VLLVISRILTSLVAILLLSGAYQNAFGIDGLMEAVELEPLPFYLKRELPGLVLHLTWHLSVLAVLLLWAAVRTPSWFQTATIFCGITLFGDFILVYNMSGWLSGTKLLLFTVICLLAVSIMLKFNANKSKI